jgi:hypothetical protein
MPEEDGEGNEQKLPERSRKTGFELVAVSVVRGFIPDGREASRLFGLGLLRSPSGINPLATKLFAGIQVKAASKSSSNAFCASPGT